MRGVCAWRVRGVWYTLCMPPVAWRMHGTCCGASRGAATTTTTATTATTATSTTATTTAPTATRPYGADA